MKLLLTTVFVFSLYAASAQWNTTVPGRMDFNGVISTSYGRTVILGAGTRPSFLVGVLPYSDGNAFQKLKIEVYGGDWHNTTMGEITYYISSRNGLLVNREIHGGAVDRFQLKIFDYNGHYEVAIQVTQDFPAFTIRSWMLDGNTGLHELFISEYTPAGTDVTPSVINTLFATSNNGNIGIGTLPTSDRLTVDGNIKCEEVTVEIVQGTGPDYVFQKDYNLLPLSEVEAYINQNKHLPEVPSAKEMEANGLNLKEMNLLLLKKVEELTLHLIEKEKKMTALEARIEQLEKQ